MVALGGAGDPSLDTAAAASAGLCNKAAGSCDAASTAAGGPPPAPAPPAAAGNGDGAPAPAPEPAAGAAADPAACGALRLAAAHLPPRFTSGPASPQLPEGQVQQAMAKLQVLLRLLPSLQHLLLLPGPPHRLRPAPSQQPQQQHRQPGRGLPRVSAGGTQAGQHGADSAGPAAASGGRRGSSGGGGSGRPVGGAADAALAAPWPPPAATYQLAWAVQPGVATLVAAAAEGQAPLVDPVRGRALERGRAACLGGTDGGACMRLGGLREEGAERRAAGGIAFPLPPVPLSL
jgi:nicotinate-nucleotide--dimethylbenzimidazole phosphoribosyltransferase